MNFRPAHSSVAPVKRRSSIVSLDGGGEIDEIEEPMHQVWCTFYQNPERERRYRKHRMRELIERVEHGSVHFMMIGCGGVAINIANLLLGLQNNSFAVGAIYLINMLVMVFIKGFLRSPRRKEWLFERCSDPAFERKLSLGVSLGVFIIADSWYLLPAVLVYAGGCRNGANENNYGELALVNEASHPVTACGLWSMRASRYYGFYQGCTALTFACLVPLRVPYVVFFAILFNLFDTIYQARLDYHEAGGGTWLSFYLIIFNLWLTSAITSLTLICCLGCEKTHRRLFVREDYHEQRHLKDQAIIQIKAKKNRRYSKKLHEARDLVERVMSEGGSLLKPYEIAYESLSFGKLLGQGAFGAVYAGTLRGETWVAIKTMRVGKVSRRELQNFKNEVCIMAPLHHPNLVNLYGGCWNEGADKLALVLELCDRGSLEDVLDDFDLTVLDSWGEIRRAFALGIARCMRYLHYEQASGKPLIHRDLKPANVLVDAGLDAKVADFGQSTLFDNENAAASSRRALTMTVTGTPLFMAPEILACLPYNEKVDVYSYALVLVAIVAGDGHFVQDGYPFGVRYAALDKEHGGLGWRPPLEELDVDSGALAALIRACWASDYTARPDFAEIVACLERRENTVEKTRPAESTKLNSELAPIVQN